MCNKCICKFIRKEHLWRHEQRQVLQGTQAGGGPSFSSGQSEETKDQSNYGGRGPRALRAVTSKRQDKYNVTKTLS